MRGPGGWWGRKTTPAKVETYTRWSFHFFGVIEITLIGLASFAQVDTGPASVLTLAAAVHVAACLVTASRALDWTRGRRARPLGMVWALGTLTAVMAAGALLYVDLGPGDDTVATAVGGHFGVLVTFGVGIMALGMTGRRQLTTLVCGFTLGSGAVALLLGSPVTAALVTVASVLFGTSFLALTSFFSVWLLNAVYALDEARETRARLAVAEERLRFGRDLHDVIGRNLAVIALKSELAVQLTRRERPEAVEQMIEVQRIARESQREVRDVVRGYREADLDAELTGARGVLGAAGIACEVSGDTAGLPAPVQSALGWVVREATTNVLRHGAAERCAVTVRTAGERVVLTVENDGAGEAPGGADDGTGDGTGRGAAGRRGGSGLAGLRERLTAVDGTLEAGRADGGVFRVVAEVPLGAGAGLGVTA